MKRMIAALGLCMILITPALAEEKTAHWDVCFTPGENCTEVIVRELRKARKTILVQAYSFTSAPIAKALVEAHKQKIDVRVILDKSQRTEQYSSADFVAHAGIQTWIDTCCAIAHNKVMVIDGETVITGSFNFTKSAQERNAENLIILKDRNLALHYTSNWKKHVGTSERYEGKRQ